MYVKVCVANYQQKMFNKLINKYNFMYLYFKYLYNFKTNKNLKKTT